MLCGLLTMQQASIGDGLSLDPFPFDEDGLATLEVDAVIGRPANVVHVRVRRARCSSRSLARAATTDEVKGRH